MFKNTDLHLHTIHSDGLFSVEAVLKIVHERNYRCVSITDHDTFEAYKTAPKIAEELGIELIPGIEVSSVDKGRDIHILGYFCDTQNEEFLSALKIQHESRKERVKKSLEKLQKLGVNISYEQVEEHCLGVSIGRPHIAAALQAAKYVSSFSEAFDLYLKDGAPAYTPLDGFTPEEAISLIKKSGGIAVMAHPEYTDADDLIPYLVQCGIEGIEVYNFKTTKNVKKYKKIAKQYKLIETGGSDFHRLDFGSFGAQKLPYSIVETLKELHAKNNVG